MSKPIHWLTLFAVVLSVVVGLYLWRASETPAPQITQPTTASPPKEPAIRYPIEAAGPAQEAGELLPALADSDKAMQDALAKLLGRNLAEFFNLQGIIHRVVATVDNLPLGHLPAQLLPVKSVPGWLVTTGKDEELSLSPKNAARYQPYVRVAKSVPITPLVAVYIRFYPLFQEQYEKLGYPDKYFNDRLVQVIDHLLATPEV
ncbi:MAG TPA: DUF3014 domain-containing protein, partial [Candidatus Binatia bacterium]|nr:DUF3014 domain-containing protein [Candidatus Binatia bacterium]